MLFYTEGVLAKTGGPFDKGAIYKVLNTRAYLGPVTHKGTVCAGEHQAIASQDLCVGDGFGLRATVRPHGGHAGRDVPHIGVARVGVV